MNGSSDEEDAIDRSLLHTRTQYMPLFKHGHLLPLAVVHQSDPIIIMEVVSPLGYACCTQTSWAAALCSDTSFAELLSYIWQFRGVRAQTADEARGLHRLLRRSSGMGYV